MDTYGRQFSMSRQAFINDDVGFITEVPGLYAASAKRTINKQVYKILVDNPAIFDGVPLFERRPQQPDQRGQQAQQTRPFRTL